MYNTQEGRSVKLEAFGKFGPEYQETLNFVWEACKRAVLEAEVDLSWTIYTSNLPFGIYIMID